MLAAQATTRTAADKMGFSGPMGPPAGFARNGGGAVCHELSCFRIERQGDVTVVTPTVFDFIDQTTNFESKKELVHFAQQEQPDKVVIDFQNIQRFSTEFIGTLLSFKKQMGAGGKIKLCSLQPVQRDIFRVLNLDGTVFQILDDVNAAVQSFA